MSHLATADRSAPQASPLVLCDRLISLAQDADRAGFIATAERLVRLAHTMFEERGEAA